MTVTEPIPESLGFSQVTVLGRDGKELIVRVPYLPGLTALRLEKRVVNQLKKAMALYEKVPKKEEGESEEDYKKRATVPITEYLDVLFDDEGVQLQVELVCVALKMTEDEINEKFTVDALNRIYGLIIRRDYKLQDILETFKDRFGNLFGSEENPQTTPGG